MTRLSCLLVFVFATALLFSSCQIVNAQITLGVFGSNMVLQRNTNAVVYGQWTPNAHIQLTINTNDAYSTTVASNGAWAISLKPYAASSNNTIVITDSTTTQTLTSVAFGEVILCTGQANTEYALPATSAYPSVQNDNFPDLRFYTVATKGSIVPVTTITNREAAICPNSWCSASPTTLKDQGDPFGYPSALCYYTARLLFMKFNQQVPVGALASSFSGTPIEAWSSLDGYNACLSVSSVGLAPSTWTTADAYYFAAITYNAMIYPLLQMRFAANIWYQGEGNGDTVRHSAAYACQLPAFISDWRAKFNLPNWPFIVIQLPPWVDPPVNSGNYFKYLRNSQMQALTLQNTSVVCLIDAGQYPDLDAADNGEHPQNKDLVAYRAYLQLLDLAYGGSVVSTGPLFTSITWPTASSLSIVLNFGSSANNQGLYFNNTASYQTVAPANGCLTSPFVIITSATPAGYRLTPTLSGSTITLPLTDAQFNEGITLLQFDVDGFPMCALYNSAGLPAYPFNITAFSNAPPFPTGGPAPSYSPYTAAPGASTTSAPGASTTSAPATTASPTAKPSAAATEGQMQGSMILSAIIMTVMMIKQ